MRKDICYFYPLPVQQVYDAFVQGAYQQFGKRCKTDPYKTINFGLDYSFKYNMNGGSLTAHFMPYQNGTAIDLRYTMVQAVAGRYKRHAEDYTGCINRLLGAQAQPIQLDINLFLSYEAGAPAAVPQQTPPVQQPVQTQPVQQPTPVQAPVRRFCPNCGSPITPQARFCANCGAKLQ